MSKGFDFAELARQADPATRQAEEPVPPLEPREPTKPPPTAEEIAQLAKMPGDEWNLDGWGWFQQQDIKAKIRTLRERWARNTSRTHLVDLDNPERPEVGYLVKGLVPAQVPVWIWGLWSGGKTIAALDLGCRLAMGLPYMGHEVVRSKVLFIQVEDSQVMMLNRLDAWKSANGDVDSDFFGLVINPDFVFTAVLEERLDNGQGGETLHETRVRQTKSVRDLIDHCKDERIDVVIIDNLASAMPSSNMSDPEVKAVIDACHQIVAEAKVTLFVVAHSNAKDESIAGLTVLQNLFNTALHVRKRADRRTIELTKSKTLDLAKVKPMAFDIVDSDVVVDGESVGVVRFRGDDDNAEKLVMQAVYALSDELPVSKNAIDKQIRDSGKSLDRKRCLQVIDQLADEGVKLTRAGAKFTLPD